MSKQKSKDHKMFKELFEAAVEGIVIADPITKKFILVNPRMTHITGYSEDELLRLGVEDIHRKKDLPHILETFKKQAMGKMSIAKDIPVLKKDGSLEYYDINSAPLKIQGEKMIAGFFREATERHKAEEASAKSEEKYRTLVGNIPGMVYRGKSDWTAEVLGKVMVICGYPASEFNSGRRNWVDIIHPDDRQRVIEEGAGLIEKPGEMVQVYRIIDRRGRVRWVEDHKVSFFDNGAFRGVDGVVFDVTSKKDVEKEKDMLQHKLQQYARRLEIKVKRLEKFMIDLTDKEKAVLLGMFAEPLLNDRELESSTGVNRSTVTAIRNRLRKDRLFAASFVPDISALGCRYITLIYGNIAGDQVRAYFEGKDVLPGFFWSQVADTRFFSLFASDDLVQFQKEAYPLIDSWHKDGALGGHKIVHFPLELSVVHRFFDFSPLVNSRLGTGAEGRMQAIPDDRPRLTSSLCRVFLAHIKNPESSIIELAEGLDMSPSTVAGKRKILLEGCFMKKVLIPHPGEFGLGTMVLEHEVFDNLMDKEVIKDVKCRPQCVFGITSDRERLSISLFTSYGEYLDSEDGSEIGRAGTVQFPLDRKRSLDIDFVSLAEQCLEKSKLKDQK